MAGIDRAAGAWMVVVLEEGRVSAHVADRLDPMHVGGASIVGIDMPIGLPTDRIGRRCDEEARRMLGARGSTVFPALPRDLYESPYDAATRALARARYGRAHSKQAWNLGPAVLETENFAGVRSGVVEVHPELVFASVAGGAIPPKRTRDGVRTRIDLLASVGVEVGPAMGGGARAGNRHDLLDAVACAVGARRVASGVFGSVPPDPAPGEPVIHY
ncbi:MAG: DUF429 domain-containing protein [Actinobacteria bacterium]|nr:DUF429 domain-containing protein [Actinomycetota bacterium]NIS35865.1 DUF429 domain-containing protein [Actinomycetota bacterium]NIT98391.1 DUF429 domain-containing protein [Actinomycetota bacterium]NIU22004.1 DUF429 domain-containing protein [Actinomycetota bacterium]NIU70483.1 DUF429 domain-containing protein [Actinomycetota bacterium]